YHLMKYGAVCLQKKCEVGFKIVRILIITKNFPPKIDGVGDYSYHLASHLQSQGCETLVLTDKEVPKIEAFSRVKVYRTALDQENIESTKQAILKIKPYWVNFQYVGYSFHSRGFPFWLKDIFCFIKSQNIKIMLTVHETYIR